MPPPIIPDQAISLEALRLHLMQIEGNKRHEGCFRPVLESVLKKIAETLETEQTQHPSRHFPKGLNAVALIFPTQISCDRFEQRLSSLVGPESNFEVRFEYVGEMGPSGHCFARWVYLLHGGAENGWTVNVRTITSLPETSENILSEALNGKTMAVMELFDGVFPTTLRLAPEPEHPAQRVAKTPMANGQSVGHSTSKVFFVPFVLFALVFAATVVVMVALRKNANSPHENQRAAVGTPAYDVAASPDVPAPPAPPPDSPLAKAEGLVANGRVEDAIRLLLEEAKAKEPKAAIPLWEQALRYGGVEAAELLARKTPEQSDAYYKQAEWIILNGRAVPEMGDSEVWANILDKCKNWKTLSELAKKANGAKERADYLMRAGRVLGYEGRRADRLKLLEVANALLKDVQANDDHALDVVLACIACGSHEGHDKIVTDKNIQDKAKAGLEGLDKIGCPLATTTLARLEGDPTEKRKLLEKAAERGEPQAHWELAEIIKREKAGDDSPLAVTSYPPEAIDHLLKAAENFLVANDDLERTLRGQFSRMSLEQKEKCRRVFPEAEWCL